MMIDQLLDRLMEYVAKAAAVVLSASWLLAAIWPGPVVISGSPIRNEFLVRGILAFGAGLGVLMYWSATIIAHWRDRLQNWARERRRGQ